MTKKLLEWPSFIERDPEARLSAQPREKRKKRHNYPTNVKDTKL